MSDNSSYPEYRDSGVEWLGQLPSHWSALRGSAFLFECRKRNDGLKSENYLSLMANRGVMLYAEKGAVGNKKPEDLTKCKVVEVGDFVINSMNYSIGSYGLSRYNGVCSPVYVVMKHNAEITDEKFVDLVLSNSAYQNYAQSFGTGILDHRRAIGWDEIKRIVVGIPPLKEQRAIANWTHKQTFRIDTLISKKSKFLELLKERREAVISKAVTKGLNDSAQMKDSGVKWLGLIPAHWEFGSIRRWFDTASGGTPETSQQETFYTNGIHPWIRTTDLNNDRLSSYEISITDAAIKSSACSILPAGCVLVAMYGGGGTIGKNALLGIEACINQALCALLPNEKFSSEYTFRYIQHFKPYWMVNAQSTRKDPNISQELIRSAPIPRPPIQEQIVIAKHLDVEIGRIDTLISKTERSIDLLKEHRAALITAAVTGKIDVRETT